jgi:hypothetical protein
MKRTNKYIGAKSAQLREDIEDFHEDLMDSGKSVWLTLPAVSAIINPNGGEMDATIRLGDSCN